MSSAEQRAIVPGAIMACRIVGVLLMQDEHGGDEKLIAVPIVKQILQAESHFGIVPHGFERHVLDEMGWQTEYNSVWRIATVNRPETREIVTQHRCDQSVHECAVLY